MKPSLSLVSIGFLKVIIQAFSKNVQVSEKYTFILGIFS